MILNAEDGFGRCQSISPNNHRSNRAKVLVISGSSDPTHLYLQDHERVDLHSDASLDNPLPCVERTEDWGASPVTPRNSTQHKRNHSHSGSLNLASTYQYPSPASDGSCPLIDRNRGSNLYDTDPRLQTPFPRQGLSPVLLFPCLKTPLIYSASKHNECGLRALTRRERTL